MEKDNMKSQIVKVNSESDIPKELAQTPIGQLLRYQNFSAPFKKHDKAEMLVGMCMDNRKQLTLPENFAYIIRTGGGNLRYSEFKLSYAIAIAHIRYVALIAHNHCGMVGLTSLQNDFVAGLSELPGWDKNRAKEHFLYFAPMFEIDNEVEFVIGEAKRLGKKYQGVSFIPLYYTIEDNTLSLIKET